MSNSKYSSATIPTAPVKRFFVQMLTRDIDVEDAILDLLDNCVDGVQRTLQQRAEEREKEDKGPDTSIDPKKPYTGFWSHIKISADSFEIQDNCGGIPWDKHDSAFRMGRPKEEWDNIGNENQRVGVYGIGMKRAVFKMGNQAMIATQSGEDRYQVLFDSEWLNLEDQWDLQPEAAKTGFDEDGTLILVESLESDIKELFAAERFRTSLLQKIESHYAVILGKGFQVKVNGVDANPKPVQFRFDLKSPDAIMRPFIFKSEKDGVDVFLAVGLREPIPDVERTLASQTQNVFSSDYAGWTVICNDRVVVYCNRDELTGWGTTGVPRYHTQFISISGVVEFRGDPRKLPTTTTKRGLNANSALYQQVLNKMKEGTRVFIDFTNDWKSREEQAKKYVEPVEALSYDAVKTQVNEEQALTLSQTRGALPGFQYRPKLPQAPTESSDVRISYYRDKERVEALGDEIVPERERVKDKDFRRMVGEISFDHAYDEYVDTDTE